MQKETREFEATLGELERLGAWLVEQACPVVAMESTGVYWKPVYHVLQAAVEFVIGYHLLRHGACYEEDRYLRTNPRLEARWRNNAVHTLQRLGYSVTIEPALA